MYSFIAFIAQPFYKTLGPTEPKPLFHRMWLLAVPEV